MTQISKPNVSVEIIGVTGSGGPGVDPINIITPPIPPLNATDDTFWETAVGPAFTWDTGVDPDSWVTDIGFNILFRLVVITSGPNLNWQVGIRPTAVRMVVNSGPSADFGEPDDNVISMRNVSGDTIMSQIVPFTTSDETIEFTAPIDFNQVGPNLDIDRIHADTFLYNSGPQISLIEFIF